MATSTDRNSAARVVVCLALLACGEPMQPTAAMELEFTCDASASTESNPLKRLTTTQYRNTVRDLTRWALGEVHEADATLALAGLDDVPTDRNQPTARDPHGSFRRFDQVMDQPRVDETFRVAATLGRLLTHPTRLGRVAGACAIDADSANDEACFASFMRRFGARALRRPLDATDEAFYGSEQNAYADLITLLLSAPEFLYAVEHGEDEVPGRAGSYALSPYELASRLSYHFWQTLPDDALWSAAEDRSLLRPEVLAAQVRRLLDDPRARATMAEFFSDFLELERLPELDAHARDSLFAALAGGDLPGPQLREHVIDDALDMLAYYTWTAPGGLEELLTSELSFARSADLAQLYGTLAWDGHSTPPALPEGERPGLLTRVWFLAGSSPILRGVFMRRKLLCDELPPPPPGASALLPELRSDRTTRQVVEELTEQPNTTCASCHATLINPLGFAFEGFDSLGRARAQQRLFRDDGTEAGSLPIDTRSVPRVTPSDESGSSGPMDVIRLMLQSGKLEACFARNYFRFTFGRYEDVAGDGCALERVRSRLEESGRIRDMLEEAALLPELQQRRFEP